MLRSVMLSLLALLSWQAQAAYKCEVNQQDDIFITPQQVQVVSASGNLVISPQGDVTRSQTALTLTAAQPSASDGIAFHHQAVKQVEQAGRQLVQQALGGVL